MTRIKKLLQWNTSVYCPNNTMDSKKLQQCQELIKIPIMSIRMLPRNGTDSDIILTIEGNNIIYNGISICCLDNDPDFRIPLTMGGNEKNPYTGRYIYRPYSNAYSRIIPTKPRIILFDHVKQKFVVGIP